jgi:hypothetical protein
MGKDKKGILIWKSENKGRKIRHKGRGREYRHRKKRKEIKFEKGREKE